MRIFIVGLALMLAISGASLAEAQERKKTQKSEKSEQTSTPSGSYPRCEGGLFFVEDGGMGPMCQRRDGKVCQVRGGTSGQAIMTECR